MVLLGTISIVSASDSIADNSSDDSVEPLISDSIDEDDVVGDELMILMQYQMMMLWRHLLIVVLSFQIVLDLIIIHMI